MSSVTDVYVGWKKWYPSDEELVEFYTNNTVPVELKENEYLLIYDKDNTLVAQCCFENGKLKKIGRSTIKISKPKELREPGKENQKVYAPRNDEQICAFDLIKDRNKPVKLITGGWGTGKTMILVTGALEALKHNVFDKIIWIRNNVDVKDTKDLGALPGEVLDKLLPFLGPFIDHAGEDEVRTMLNKGSLVVEPLQSLRGRNFENSLIMCSESENLTREHIQLIIARAADGSEVWLDGDTRQRDKAAFEKSKGLETMIERLAGNELFGYVHLIKSERSQTAALADLLD